MPAYRGGMLRRVAATRLRHGAGAQRQTEQLALRSFSPAVTSTLPLLSAVTKAVRICSKGAGNGHEGLPVQQRNAVAASCRTSGLQASTNQQQPGTAAGHMPCMARSMHQCSSMHNPTTPRCPATQSRGRVAAPPHPGAATASSPLQAGPGLAGSTGDRAAEAKP